VAEAAPGPPARQALPLLARRRLLELVPARLQHRWARQESLLLQVLEGPHWRALPLRLAALRLAAALLLMVAAGKRAHNSTTARKQQHIIVKGSNRRALETMHHHLRTWQMAGRSAATPPAVAGCALGPAPGDEAGVLC
jgi:hypothetical protein